jgi:hypothetical protein
MTRLVGRVASSPRRLADDCAARSRRRPFAVTRCSFVASAAARSALLLQLVAGPEQQSDAGLCRTMTWSVVRESESLAVLPAGADDACSFRVGRCCRLWSRSRILRVGIWPSALSDEHGSLIAAQPVQLLRISMAVTPWWRRTAVLNWLGLRYPQRTATSLTGSWVDRRRSAPACMRRATRY